MLTSRTPLTKLVINLLENDDVLVGARSNLGEGRQTQCNARLASPRLVFTVRPQSEAHSALQSPIAESIQIQRASLSSADCRRLVCSTRRVSTWDLITIAMVSILQSSCDSTDTIVVVDPKRCALRSQSSSLDGSFTLTCTCEISCVLSVASEFDHRTLAQVY